jgi:hypothetical protein
MLILVAKMGNLPAGGPGKRFFGRERIDMRPGIEYDTCSRKKGRSFATDENPQLITGCMTLRGESPGRIVFVAVWRLRYADAKRLFICMRRSSTALGGVVFYA